METITVVAKSVVAPSTTNILPEPFRSTWIRALRFGYMPQTTGTLTRGEAKHCCLGIGATLADQLRYINDGGFMHGVTPDRSTATWYGPNDELRRLPSSDFIADAKALSLLHVDNTESLVAGILADLNDAHVNHADIANLIEKHL
jgi:hypothetical protein